MSLTVRERVQQGAELLDQRAPGWYLRVNVDRLRIQSGHDCVLGQNFGHYTYGVPRVRLTQRNSWAFGFNTKRDHLSRIPGLHWLQKRQNANEFTELDAEWGRLIKERLALTA